MLLEISLVWSFGGFFYILIYETSSSRNKGSTAPTDFENIYLNPCFKHKKQHSLKYKALRCPHNKSSYHKTRRFSTILKSGLNPYYVLYMQAIIFLASKSMGVNLHKYNMLHCYFFFCVQNYPRGELKQNRSSKQNKLKISHWVNGRLLWIFKNCSDMITWNN